MDSASNRDRPGQASDEPPARETRAPTDDNRAGEVREADARAALDETTPADRADWEASLDADDPSA